MTTTKHPQQMLIWRTGLALLFAFASGTGGAAVSLVPATALQVVAIEVDGKSVNELAQPSIGPPSAPVPVAKLVVNAPIVRGVLVSTPATATLTLKSKNGTIIRMEPGSELFVHAVIAGGEVYDLRSGVEQFETTQPLRFLVVQRGSVRGVARQAKFTVEIVEVGNGIRYTVEKGTLEFDERVSLIDSASNRRIGVREISTLNSGGVRGTSNDQRDRKQTRFDTLEALEAFVASQLTAAELSTDLARRRLALRNALYVAVQLGKMPEAIAYHDKWLATADDDLEMLAQNAFEIATVCSASKNKRCAVEYYQKALAFREQLYPDGLHLRILQTRRSLADLYQSGDQKEYEVLTAQIGQMSALMPPEKDTPPSVTKSEPIKLLPSETITPVSMTKRGPIKFPENMRQWGFQGDGLVDVTVTAEGKSINLKVTRSPHPAFEQAIVKSVLASEFKPATKDDRAINQRLWIPFSFRFTGSVGERLSDGDPPFAFPKTSDSDAPEFAQYDEPPKIEVVAPVVYPRELLQKGVTGVAKVLASLDAKGRVHSVAIVDAANPEFGAATKAMIEAWEFKPAMKNRKPIAIVFAFEQKFRRTDRDTGVNDHTKTLLKALASKSSEIAELDALDKRPQTLYQPQPVDMRIAGAVPEEVVTIEFFIDPEGFVQLPRIISANDMNLGWAAATAIKRWVFEVPTIKGEPVFARRELQFTFK